MPILTSRFEEALAFAASLHRDQIRKDTQIPYVSHLLACASLALEHGADEDQAIAALLHDAVEDQGGMPTAALIRERFGPEVERIVLACSEATVTPKPPWIERKRAYLAHLSDADEAVRLVSAADKLHNARAILADLRTIGPLVWARFSEGPEQILWYYRALAGEFSRGRTPAALAAELDRPVTSIETLHQQNSAAPATAP